MSNILCMKYMSDMLYIKRRCVSGPELCRSGRSSVQLQLHRGGSGRHILGSSAAEERQSLDPPQHSTEQPDEYDRADLHLLHFCSYK